MALAARIAFHQGVAFHTSTDAAPAERGARRPSLNAIKIYKKNYVAEWRYSS